MQRDNGSSVMTVTNLTEFFRDALQSALAEQRTAVDPQAERYGSIRWAQSIGPGSPRLIGGSRCSGTALVCRNAASESKEAGRGPELMWAPKQAS